MARILAVDDDPATLVQIKEIITTLGYSAGTLANPEFLFKRLAVETFDLILMDVYMPKIDGVSLLKQLKAHPEYHQLPVIMLTGEMDSHLLAKSFQCGATDYITKPIQERVFSARLQSALATKFHQDHMLKTMQELEKAHKAAQVGNRAKEQFIANVTHEIRTPLTVILGNLQMIQEHKSKLTLEKEISFLNNAYTAANSLAELIDNVLDFSQMESGKLEILLESVSFPEFLSEIQNSFLILAKQAEVSLRFEIPGDLPNVQANQTRLKQVLFNLIGNAIKFTKEGGHVSLGAETNNDQILFWIRDTGIGIPKEFQDKLFERFTRSNYSNTVKGTGIGLTITKQLIEAMNGKIWFESEPGEGTTFYFELASSAVSPF